MQRNDLSLEEQQKILYELTGDYLDLRAKDHPVFGTMHHDKEHLHMHLMISANEMEGSRRKRLSKQRLASIQKAIEAYKMKITLNLTQTTTKAINHRRRPDRANRKLRQIELSIGIKAYLVNSELKKLADDIAYWKEHNTYGVFEAAARIHHRAVQIHPFANGNGRWSRMLANIWLRLHDKMPTNWEEKALSQENENRDTYVAALKKADNGDYSELMAITKCLYLTKTD